MEEIIEAITEAEAQAAEIRAEAQSKAAALVAEAQAKADETEKTTRGVCKAYKATQNKASIAAAQNEYDAIVAQKTMEAKAYTAKILENIEATVTKIVGRVTSGDC